MNTSEEFFKEMKEWSERKLKLLDKYLAAATLILNKYDEVYYIDGFAGRGIYDDQSKGSAIRAAEIAHRLASENKSYRLKCINVELDSQNFRDLVRHTSSFSNVVTNFSGDFIDNLDSIIRIIQKKPVVCFLDPFGVSGIDWTAIRKLANRGAPTDFWIRLDTSIVARLFGCIDNPTSEATHKIDILLRTYGVSSIDVLKQRLSGYDEQDRLRKSIDFYRERLCAAYPGSAYSFDYHIRSINEESKYYFVSATANIKGAVVASNIVYGIENEYQRELENYQLQSRLKKGAPTFFDAISDNEKSEKENNDVLKENSEKIATILYQKFRGQTMLRKELHCGILDHWFGRLKGSHMTLAIKLLEKQGRASIVTGTPGSDDAKIAIL